jgi:hypothetical protein
MQNFFSGSYRDWIWNLFSFEEFRCANFMFWFEVSVLHRMIVLTGSVRLCLVVTVVFMDHLGEQCKALRIQQHCYVHSLTFQITIALVLFRLPKQLIIPNEKRYNRVLCANEFAHVNQLHVNKKYHFAKKKIHNVQTEFHYWKTTKITIVSGTYQVWKTHPLHSHWAHRD